MSGQFRTLAMFFWEAPLLIKRWILITNSLALSLVYVFLPDNLASPLSNSQPNLATHSLLSMLYFRILPRYIHLRLFPCFISKCRLAIWFNHFIFPNLLYSKACPCNTFVRFHDLTFVYIWACLISPRRPSSCGANEARARGESLVTRIIFTFHWYHLTLSKFIFDIQFY